MSQPHKKGSAGSARAAYSAAAEDTDFDALVSAILFQEGGEAKARFHDHGIKTPFALGFLNIGLDEEAATAFSEGFALYAEGLATYGSRYSSFKGLKYGFGAFLRQKRESRFTLADIDTEFVAKFDAWLSLRYPVARRRRTAALRPFREILTRLRLMPRWEPLVRDDIEFPLLRQDRKTRPAVTNKILSEPDYDALWVAASRKSKLLVSLHERRKAALAAWDGRTPTFEEARADPVALAALITHMYPKDLPPSGAAPRGRMRRAFPNEHWAKAISILMPRVGELVPAIIIIATVFAYNADVVKQLRYRLDYTTGPTLGRKRLFVHPLKYRGTNKRQRHAVVATEDGDNPARVIAYIEERTAFLRYRAEPPHANLLFLWLAGRPISFAGSDWTFRQALAVFAKRHRISGLQLKKIRPSTLDRVHRVTDGDLLKVKSFAHHSSIQTTFRDYKTDAIAQRDTEALGRAMQQNERFLQSGGIIRPFLVDPELDRGSATPGYACLDPLDSPIRGEEDGVLCKAYGRCPICPLAMIHQTPRAYAYLDALSHRIDEALTEDLVSDVEWIGRWSIVKKSLLRQMRCFSDEMIMASADAKIPELPPLE